jgi:PAS domain S-box-containing protein
MEKELHILILEDLPSDAELAQKELKTVLKNYTVKVVDTEEGFVQALATFKPDLIISDYQLPSFDGLSALKITQDKSPFTPFVILTGSMNEDTAVECMKAGADDYVIKEHIKSLGPAVLNAMENKKIELERKQTEEKLKDSEEHLKILFDYAPDAYYISDLKGKFIDGNIAAERLLGYKKEELIGKNFLKLKLLSLTDIPKAAKLLAKNLRRLPTGPNEFVLNRKDNSKVTVEISTYPVKIKGRTLVLGIARDITERKQAEEEVRESEEKYRAVLEQSADNIFLVDLETKKILESNVSLRNLLGYSVDEMKEITVYDFVAHPKDEIKKKLEQLQMQDKTVMRERKYLRKDGSLVDSTERWFAG